MSPADFAIKCPNCEKPMDPSPTGGDRRAVCPSCQSAYPCFEGVVDLVPELEFKRTVSQAFMESPAIVRIYESRLWRRSPLFALYTGISFDREAKLIIEAAGVGAESRVLDLACGSGIYTRPLARVAKEGRVTGLDLSRPMLSLASLKAREEGLANIALLRGNAMALPFFDASFNAVNCCGALHLFPDTRRVLGEISRVLAPGGVFTAAVFRRKGRLAGRLVRRFSGVNSYTWESFSGMLAEAGFDEIRPLHEAGVWMMAVALKA